MGRPRTVRTPEEAAAVPLDRPVSIDLTAVPDKEKPIETEELDKPEVIEPPLPEPPEVEEEEEQENPLAKQLEELKAAEARAQQQLQEARAREEAAVRAAQQREHDLWRERGVRDQAIYDSVLNAIGAAQSEVDRAQADLAAAMAAQDYGVAADAQRRLSMATTRLVRFEDDKAALEERAQQPAPQPQPVGDPVLHAIDSNQTLSYRQKEWLKGHRDAFTDPAKNAYLGAAHHKAIAAGHGIDSDAYFAAIETELGYRQPAAPAPTAERKSIPMSAPTSREAPSLSGAPTASPSRITLTASQREAARISGIDEVTYAKNLIRLNELKKQGHYQERG